jgi:hypothetical protein
MSNFLPIVTLGGFRALLELERVGRFPRNRISGPWEGSLVAPVWR